MYNHLCDKHLSIVDRGSNDRSNSQARTYLRQAAADVGPEDQTKEATVKHGRSCDEQQQIFGQRIKQQKQQSNTDIFATSSC